MIFLGIDPGSRHTGFGVIEKQGERLVAVEHGRISPSTRDALPTRLNLLSREVGSLVDRARPEAVALETPFHGVNSRSLIVLAQARGALLAAIAARDLPIREYSPAEIKSAVSGNGRADKGQVATMVSLILGLPEPPNEDASDALAAAICCAQRHRFDQLSTGS